MAELLDYFESPATRFASPEVWLLGSSPQSAIWAAESGLPYAFADFISPDGAPLAQYYREHFQPSPRLQQPKTAVCVWAICAETEEHALRLSLSARMMMLLLFRGQLIPVPPVEKAAEFLAREAVAPQTLPMRRRIITGNSRKPGPRGLWNPLPRITKPKKSSLSTSSTTTPRASAATKASRKRSNWPKTTAGGEARPGASALKLQIARKSCDFERFPFGKPLAYSQGQGGSEENEKDSGRFGFGERHAVGRPSHFDRSRFLGVPVATRAGGRGSRPRLRLGGRLLVLLRRDNACVTPAIGERRCVSRRFRGRLSPVTCRR